MSYCDDFIKYALFVFNLGFALSGLALIIAGSVFISKSTFLQLVEDLEKGLKTPQVFLIVLGFIIFFIASLGCCGAIRENQCVLIAFSILLLACFIVQVAIGIYALINRTSFDASVNKGLRKEFPKITNSEIKSLFEAMERELECCGVDSSADYPEMVPLSCCADRSECTVKPGEYFQKGCSKALTTFTGRAGIVLGSLILSLAAIELMGAIFALRLASLYF